MIDDRWKWVYRKPSGRESGRLNLLSPSGKVAATVFTFYQGPTFGHNWFVWDERGTGGENSGAATIDAAIEEAEAAVVRWGAVRD